MFLCVSISSGFWVLEVLSFAVILSDERVVDVETMFYTFTEQNNSIQVSIANSLLPNCDSQKTVVPTDPGIKIPK
jgi:hypothetical protein